jgi:hypothetical protein
MLTKKPGDKDEVVTGLNAGSRGILQLSNCSYLWAPPSIEICVPQEQGACW